MTVTLDGEVPLAGFTVIQPGPVTTAVQVTGAELVRLNVIAAGLNPAIALRFSCEGLTEMVAAVNDHTLPALVELKPTTSTRQ